MLLVLPALALPFVTMAFWALGGGKQSGTPMSNQNGLNLNLPSSGLKEDNALDKLSFYDRAAKDSARLAEQIKNDPYYQREQGDALTPPTVDMIASQTAAKYKQPVSTSPYLGTFPKTEDEILKKVALLKDQLDKPQMVTKERDKADAEQPANPRFSSEVDRLEKMMQTMNPGEADDPQMNQMSSMLDKILAIQHPDRIKEPTLKNREQILPVTKSLSTVGISLLGADKRSMGENSFYGESNDQKVNAQNAIEAAVHQTQTLVDGTVIKLRLLNDIYTAGNRIEKESFVYGRCTLNGERLNIEVHSIRSGNNLFPVRLEVYDMDGLPGLCVPGTITREVAKQSADNSLQLMELGTMNPSLKTQAAATGISTLKNILSKKAKLVKVTVKSGYKVLLKEKLNS